MHPILIATLWLGTASIASSAPPAAASRSEAPTGDRLTAAIAGLDRTVFDAYNHCDPVTFARYFAPDIEFYHDKTGLTVGRAKLVEAVKNNICGKVRRELVAGTLEVYPLKDFGAVEMGTHRFCQIGGDRCDGVARFIHLWQYRDGAWRITRAISYDHHRLTP